MPVVSTATDPATLTLTFVAELPAPPSRAWELWSDPRQLEQWWGPPTWPATFTEHDLTTGGGAKYHMTGPEGEKAHGWWTFLEVDAPRSLRFEDGFADDDGVPSTEMPTTWAEVRFEETDEGTRMTITSHFATLEQLEQLAQMGMVEGMTEALSQIDGILATN